MTVDWLIVDAGGTTSSSSSSSQPHNTHDDDDDHDSFEHLFEQLRLMKGDSLAAATCPVLSCTAYNGNA